MKSGRISRQPGLTIFIISTFIAIMLGASMRKFFAEENLKAWILTQIGELPENANLESDKARLSLADGIKPQLAVEVLGLSAEKVSDCQSHKLKVEKLIFPLSLWSLIKGKVELGTVSLYQAQLLVKDRLCAQHEPNEPILTHAPSQLNKPAPQEQTQQQDEKLKWWNELEKTVNLPQGIFIYSLALNYEEVYQKPKKILFSNMEIEGWPPKNNLILSGSVKFLDGWFAPGFQPTTSILLELQPTQLKAELKGQWKEALIDFEISVQNKNAQPYAKFTTDLKHLPVGLLSSIFPNAKWIDEKLTGHKIWLSCLGESESQLQEIGTGNWDLKNCKIQGDLGELQLSDVHYTPYSEKKFNPFVIKLNNINIAELFRIFSRSYNQDAYGTLGFLTGELAIESEDSADFKGAVEQIELMVSNGETRRPQLIRSIHTQMSLNKGRVSGVIDTAELERGKIEGRATFNFDRDLKDGIVQFNFNKINFSPEIQGLLVNGELGESSLLGKFFFLDGELSSWSGVLAAQNIIQKESMFEKPKLIVEGKKGSPLRGQVKLDRIKIEKSSPIFEWIKPAFLDHPLRDDGIEFKGLEAKIEKWNNAFVWKSARTQSERIKFSSDGSWNDQGEILGWLNVEFPSLKKLKWNITGTRSDPKLIANSKWLKQLAEEAKTRE